MLTRVTARVSNYPLRLQPASHWTGPAQPGPAPERREPGERVGHPVRDEGRMAVGVLDKGADRGAWPPGPGRGGNCLPKRRCCSEVATPDHPIHTPAITAYWASRSIRPAQGRSTPGPPGSRMKLASTAAAARARQPPDPAATLACGRRRAGTSGRVGPDAVRGGGMSAVIASSSAQVRATSARPARASSSSLVSRPCANATFSASITCSRSACDARMGPRPVAPAAISSPGPAIAGTFPTGRNSRVTGLPADSCTRWTSPDQGAAKGGQEPSMLPPPRPFPAANAYTATPTEQPPQATSSRPVLIERNFKILRRKAHGCWSGIEKRQGVVRPSL
jgi:hypothetical protein